jgi:hypothetical protein
VDLFDPNDRSLEDALGEAGAKVREAAAVTVSLGEMTEPSELLLAISALDPATLRNVTLVGVLHFKRSTESAEEFGAFVARLLAA